MSNMNKYFARITRNIKLRKLLGYKLYIMIKK